jgi:hypothetical protein
VKTVLHDKEMEGDKKSKIVSQVFSASKININKQATGLGGVKSVPVHSVTLRNWLGVKVQPYILTIYTTFS